MRKIIDCNGTVVDIPNKWKCKVIENLSEITECDDSPFPVQYAFQPFFFITSIPSSDEVRSPSFLKKIEEGLDFWNYLDCHDRMYFFYYLILELYLTPPNRIYNSKITRRKFFYEDLLSLRKKDFFYELKTILSFLISVYVYRRNSRGDDGEKYFDYSEFFSFKEDILLNFVIYSDNESFSSKNKLFQYPFIFDFYYHYHQISYYPYVVRDVENYNSSLLKRVIDKIDWEEEIILSMENIRNCHFFMVLEVNYQLSAEEKIFLEILLSKKWKIDIDFIRDCCTNSVIGGDTKSIYCPESHPKIEKILKCPKEKRNIVFRGEFYLYTYPYEDSYLGYYNKEKNEFFSVK